MGNFTNKGLNYRPTWASIQNKPTTISGWLTDVYTKSEVDSIVDDAIDDLVNAAPGALDTLNELAAALGDDANFATTVTNSLAGKVSLSGSYSKPSWLTQVAATIVEQSASYRFVTDTEKTTWNGKQTPSTDYSGPNISATNRFLSTNYASSDYGSVNRITLLDNITRFFNNSVESGRILANNRFLWKTTTDAGFDFDVNGVGRFTGNLSLTGSTSRLWLNSSGTYGIGYNNSTKLQVILDGAASVVFRNVASIAAQIVAMQYSSNTTAANYPAYTFDGDESTGIGRWGAGNVFISTNGVKMLNVFNDGVSVEGTFKSSMFYVSTLNTAPSSASDTGTAGEIRFTSTAIYICTATNTWKKAEIATC